MQVNTTFKRLSIGDHFTSHGSAYRKIDAKRAFRLFPATDELRPNRGQTHAKIPFARSTAVAFEPRVGAAGRDGVTPEIG